MITNHNSIPQLSNIIRNTMEKAQKLVSDFMSRDGQRKTIVDQDYRQVITEEHVRPQQHEEVTTAIDKEIHQDHHQTIIQPIQATETL